MKFYPSKLARKGFTLAELLVAMAITVVLVSLTVVITGSALDAWRGARNEIRAARQAKIMLDSMSRDLESFVIRSNNNFEWLNAKSETRDIGPDGRESPNSANLVFLTAATDRYDGNVGDSTLDRGGDVSAVGYTLEYRDPIFADENERYSSFVVYRNLIDPDQTFQGLLATEDLEQAYSSAAGGATQSKNFMCENVFEMTVIFAIEYIDSSGELKKVRVPILSSSGGANAVGELSVRGDQILADGQPPAYSRGRVVGVDLSITVLNDTGMRQIRRVPFETQDEKAKFLSENSYHYSRTVVLPQP